MMKLKKLIVEEDRHYIHDKRFEFIMDMEKNVEVFNQDGSIFMTLPRYAFWANKGKNKPEVVEGSDDLKYLQKKYNVADDRIVKLK